MDRIENTSMLTFLMLAANYTYFFLKFLKLRIMPECKTKKIINKADNPAIGAEQRMLKLFEFYILNFENFRLLIQLKSCNKEEKSV